MTSSSGEFKAKKIAIASSASSSHHGCTSSTMPCFLPHDHPSSITTNVRRSYVRRPFHFTLITTLAKTLLNYTTNNNTPPAPSTQKNQTKFWWSNDHPSSMTTKPWRWRVRHPLDIHHHTFIWVDNHHNNNKQQQEPGTIDTQESNPIWITWSPILDYNQHMKVMCTIPHGRLKPNCGARWVSGFGIWADQCQGLCRWWPSSEPPRPPSPPPSPIAVLLSEPSIERAIQPTTQVRKNQKPRIISHTNALLTSARVRERPISLAIVSIDSDDAKFGDDQPACSTQAGVWVNSDGGWTESTICSSVTDGWTSLFIHSPGYECSIPDYTRNSLNGPTHSFFHCRDGRISLVIRPYEKVVKSASWVYTYVQAHGSYPWVTLFLTLWLFYLH